MKNTTEKIIWLALIIWLYPGLAQKVQPQFEVSNKPSEPTMTYEQAIKRIPERTLPDFWMVELDRISEYLSKIKNGRVENLTKSPSGRPIDMVCYGAAEPTKRLANFNSAIGAREPVVYCNKQSRKKPVILLVGPVHGHEVEALVGLMNLINIMETGKDFRGRDWFAIQKAGQKCRLVILPACNPDGIARFEPKSLVTMTLEDIRFWGQGTWSDDTFCGWPQSKRQHPMKGDNCGFLGCYFNDEGINPMHDEFFAPMGPESKAILDLARKEAPDLAVSLHSYDAAPGILCPNYVIFEVKENIQRLAKCYKDMLQKHNLPCEDFVLTEEKGVNPPPFNLTSALYHVSGADVFTFECPHGTVSKRTCRVDLDQILDIQLFLYQAMMEFVLGNKAE